MANISGTRRTSLMQPSTNYTKPNPKTSSCVESPIAIYEMPLSNVEGRNM
jgi:hypothetical protein